jgi:hypothetical protein
VNAGQDFLPARSQQSPRVSEMSGDAALDVIFQDDFSPEDVWFSDWGPELVW